MVHLFVSDCDARRDSLRPRTLNYMRQYLERPLHVGFEPPSTRVCL
jgi:hypothetical protein